MMGFKAVSLSMFLTLVPLFGAHAQIMCSSVFIDRSQELAWLETESPERLHWIREQSGELNEALKENPDKKKIEDLIWKFHDQQRVMMSSEVDHGYTLSLIRRGLGKPTELVLDNGRRAKVLFSTNDRAENGSVYFLKYSLSPDKNHVVAFFQEKGSIDNYWAEVYSISKRAVVSERLPMRKADIAWVSSNRFVFQEASRPTSLIKTWDGSNQQVGLETNVKAIIQGGAVQSLVHNGKNFVLINHKGEETVIPFKRGVGQYLGKQGDNYVFQTDRKDGFGVIEFFNPAKSEEIPPVELNGRVIAGAGIKGDYIAVDHSYGADRKLSIFDKENKVVGELTLPAGISAAGLSWVEPGKIAKLMLKSPIRGGVSFTWDLSKQIDMAVISQKLHNDGTTQFESRFEMVKAADGVDVPMRITSKTGLERNGQNPVLITVYGGFSKPGSMHGAGPEPMKKVFLDKGGIIVAPAIRGGNEFGEVWHEQAMGADKKTTTLNDLISVADYLTAQKYTESSKIITMGTSNGGFVVAASALKSPTSFGLVIPVAGVHDMLGKERLATVSSWNTEYGDPSKPDMYQLIKEFSPVEFTLSEKPKAEFLLITGRDDSRVNTVHTYKLMKSMRDQNLAVNMLDLKNAGHWAESPDYQNVIGWRVQSVVWNRIFEFLGIKL